MRKLAALLVGTAMAVTALAAADNSPAEAQAETTISIYGMGGNCVQANSKSTWSHVRMRPCSASDLQRWEVVWSADGTYMLRLRNSLATHSSGLCLGIYNNRTANGHHANLRPCNRDQQPSVRWLWRGDLGLGKLYNHRDNANYCLDVRGAGKESGTPLQIWQCVDTSAQDFFTFTTRPSSAKTKVIGHGANCLTASSAKPDNGSWVKMYDCDGSARQEWLVYDRYLIMGHKCVDIVNGSRASGAAIQMFRCVDVPQQQWTATAGGELRSSVRDQAGETRCLDVAFQGTANGTDVWSYRCNRTSAQGWYIGELPTRFPYTGALATQLNGAIADRLGNCRSSLSLRVDNVHLVAMRNPAPFIVRRDGDSFSRAAEGAGQAWTNRAAMNGAWFHYPGTNPALIPHGDVVANGVLVSENPVGDYEGFYIAADDTNTCAEWTIGPGPNRLTGAAPRGHDFAVGGARPLIIEGQKWGTRNSGHNTEFGGARSFEEYNARSVGKPTVGVRGDGVVLMMVRPHSFKPEAGGPTLSALRDAYQRLGFPSAVLFDPSTSTSLAVNGTMRARPTGLAGSGAFNKDELILYGWGMGTR